MSGQTYVSALSEGDHWVARYVRNHVNAIQ
jgi:hypothetical protein